MYMTEGTAEAVGNLAQIGRVPWENLRIVKGGEAFSIGDIQIEPICVSHDAAEPVAYRFEAGGRKLAVVTDLGYYNQAVVGRLGELHTILLEANYDFSMLQSGSYPYPLKQRIRGSRGHLSNEDAGKLVLDIWNEDLHHVLLGHLSKENNMPLLAYETVRSEVLLSDRPEALSTMTIEVLKREETSSLIQV
jgi:phosphoribosyl 1,2-cyclic phosphodiesterase